VLDTKGMEHLEKNWGDQLNEIGATSLTKLKGTEQQSRNVGVKYKMALVLGYQMGSLVGQRWPKPRH